MFKNVSSKTKRQSPCTFKGCTAVFSVKEAIFRRASHDVCIPVVGRNDTLAAVQQELGKDTTVCCDQTRLACSTLPLESRTLCGFVSGWILDFANTFHRENMFTANKFPSSHV